MHNFKKGNKDFIGAAFENNTEFVNIVFNTFDIYHMYWGQGDVDYDRKTGNITDKIVSRYSSTNIETSKYDIGTIIKKVWRPGLNIDVKKALEIDDGEMQRGLKSLKILSDRLNDILLFIEPDTYALQCHGHKIRELLILACTEVESLWKTYLDIAGQSKDRATTVNYVKLNNALYLFEYKLTLKAYPFNISYKPFDGWNASSPTQTLPWYNAYNETKHDKIHIAEPMNVNMDMIQDKLERLQKLLDTTDNEHLKEVKECIKQVVPTFRDKDELNNEKMKQFEHQKIVNQNQETNVEALV